MPNEEMGSRALPQSPAVHTTAILLVVGGFLVFVAISIAAVLAFLKTEAPGAFAPKNERPFPPPALQTAPQNDLVNFEAPQRARLNGYDWADPGHTMARIPIDEAMRLIIARGPKAYDRIGGSSAAGTNSSGGSP